MSILGSNKDERAVKEAVVQAIDPLIGSVTNTRSKNFLLAIEEGIASVGDKVKSVFGRPLKNLLLPSQDPEFISERYNPELIDKLIAKPELKISRIQGIKTNRSTLFTYQTDFSNPNTPISEKKYIIHFNGNGTFANQIADEMVHEAKTHNCVVINFDYPGVGESTGKSERPKHMVDAGLAQVKRLINMGVPPENIILKGQSIGGGIATLTAAKLHSKDQKVFLYNQRSFSKTSKTAKHMLGGGALGKIAAFGIKRAGWEIDAIKSWKKIPEAYKDFCFGSKDTLIPPGVCGLAGALDKVNDNDRGIIAGHNDDLYGINRDLLQNANGVKGYQLFDQFAQSRFNNPVIILNQAQQSQISELVRLMEITPRNSGAKLAFSSDVNPVMKQFSNEGKVVLALLKSIEKSNKVTQLKLTDLESHFQRLKNVGYANPSVNTFNRTGDQLIQSIKQRSRPLMEPISVNKGR